MPALFIIRARGDRGEVAIRNRSFLPDLLNYFNLAIKTFNHEEHEVHEGILEKAYKT